MNFRRLPSLCLVLLLCALPRTGQATLPVAVAEAPALWLGAVRALPLILSSLSPGPCRAVGWPAFGRLDNGVFAQSTTGLYVRSRQAWGTPETVNGLRRIAQEIATLYPGRGDLIVTDISRRDGGHLKPHRTHQNGRDVDVLLYANGDLPRARDLKDLDVERTWAMLMALRRDGVADLVLADMGIQQKLYAYAKTSLELPQAELEALFQYPRGRKVKDTFLRHAKGHRTHMHIRFASPQAVAASALEDARLGVTRVAHIVIGRKETLATVAAQYGTTPESIVAENRLGPRTQLRRGQRLFVLKPVPQSQVNAGHPPEDAQGG